MVDGKSPKMIVAALNLLEWRQSSPNDAQIRSIARQNQNPIMLHEIRGVDCQTDRVKSMRNSLIAGCFQIGVEACGP